MAIERYDALVARVVERGGIALALGGLDTGKTSFARMCAAVAVRLGKTAAFIDLDIGHPTIGAPGTVSMKVIREMADLEPDTLARADARYFVGAVSPQGHLLPMVVGAHRLATHARAAGASVIVVDTCGFISGTLGEVLALHTAEILHPDMVVGFQRGEELEPILGTLRRTVSAQVESLPVEPHTGMLGADERAEHRAARLRAAFEPPLHRWKVKASALVPTVPPEMDLHALDGVLVGLEDGEGHCIGLGVLEVRDGVLGMISALAEGARALRLGSMRVTTDYHTSPVDLRGLFLTD